MMMMMMTSLCFYYLLYRVLRSLEFAGSTGEDSSQLVGIDEKAKTLETLLLEKNRSLQTENTQLKVANSELSGTSFYKQ